ncbi:MAG: hypothetical protein ABGZ53_08755, partial [Fuerstiella sp.]
TPVLSTNDIDISGPPTLSDLTMATITTINTVIGAGTALDHNLAAPNRVSIPDLDLLADPTAFFVTGGTLDLSSVAAVADLELQVFSVLGQTFTFTNTALFTGDIDISGAATVDAATAAAIGVINATLGGGTALAFDTAAPNRISIPNLPTAGASFVLGNELTIPAELGGNLEGESFFAFGRIFTFTNNAVLTTDIQVNPLDPGATIAPLAAAAINGVVGGSDRASAAGAVLQLTAFDLQFGETIRLPNGAAALGDSVTINGVTFDYVATGGFLPPNPEIVVGAGSSSTFVAIQTAAAINTQFGAGTAVRDGSKLLLTTGTVTSELGGSSTGAIDITVADTTLTFPGGTAVIGEILVIDGDQYSFIDTTGGVIPGALEIGVLPADNADAVATKAFAVLSGDFPAAGDVTLAVPVITLGNGLTAEVDNILLDGAGVPAGLMFGTELSADAVGTPLVVDAAGTTLTTAPLSPVTSPLARTTGNRVTVYSASNTEFASGSGVLTFNGNSGIAGGAVLVDLPDATATANEVAIAIRQALANQFSAIGVGPIGDITNIKGTENLIQVIGHTVNDPGLLGMTGKLSGALPGDAFGAYEAGFENNRTNRPGSLRGMDNDVEGVHIDDIIIGFAERGEMVINAPVDTGFTPNLDILNANYPVGQTWLGIDVGEYDVEIRRASDYAETGPTSPTNGLY